MMAPNTPESVPPLGADSDAAQKVPGKAVAPGSPRAWILAMRPATLTAAAAPVLVGTAISLHAGRVALAPALATFLGAFLLQIASNFANDVFDYEKGTDTEERLGPTRAVQAGLVSPRQMKHALSATLALALLVGVYLTAIAGWPILVIGVLSIVSAVAYTGGPFPLGYHGWGDVFVMVFFGFVAVCGTTFVHQQQIDPMAWIAAAGVGAVITNILVVNNVRDRQGDARSGKRTLAVRWGKGAAVAQYAALYVVSALVPVVLWLGSFAGPFVLLGLAPLPFAVKNVRRLQVLEGRALNELLERTAKLVFFYGLSLAGGLLLDSQLHA